MNRTPSPLAQAAFDLKQLLVDHHHHSSKPGQLVAGALLKMSYPVFRRIGAGHTVTGYVYGQRMIMPSEHPIVAIVNKHPQYNRPLGIVAAVLAEQTLDRTPLTAIDVGANIGETAALIEQWSPGRFTFLCLEPEKDLAEICRLNHPAGRVEVIRRFVGEDEGVVVRLEDDGRANPTTRVDAASASSIEDTLVRLETIARPFAEKYGSLDLIKVDTEGYDFSVLRSGKELLKRYRPTLYFEWYPAVLRPVDGDTCTGFDFLQSLGYRHFVFFSKVGDFYCHATDPECLFLQALSQTAESSPALLYFDVVATTSKEHAEAMVKRAMAECH